ncbi:MAG: hypothetical protein QOD06_776 [Candidatus Binatota bacterium]|jgi:hypothetical protein|nr:hypothetical protein [Candidatus Binatota bacterium]
MVIVLPHGTLRAVIALVAFAFTLNACRRDQPEPPPEPKVGGVAAPAAR